MEKWEIQMNGNGKSSKLLLRSPFTWKKKMAIVSLENGKESQVQENQATSSLQKERKHEKISETHFVLSSSFLL